MSDTTTPPTPPPPSTSPEWGAPAVAIYALTIFVVCLVVAYLTKNENLLVVLFGVAAANATAAVHFYLGSSNSSQNKDQTIKDAQTALANSTPVQVRNPNASS